jgi:hypothetical protein
VKRKFNPPNHKKRACDWFINCSLDLFVKG